MAHPNLAFHLDFLEEELTNERNVPLSHDHLQLYLRFLGRVADADVDPPALRKRLQTVRQRYADAVNRVSPLPHSGDVEQRKHVVAPLIVPMERRVQTLVLAVLNLFTGSFLFLGTLLSCLYVWPRGTSAVFGLYLGWIYFDARPCGCCGAAHFEGRTYHRWFRRLWFWRHYRDFFPVRLVRRPGVAYPPDRNYVFCVHPHGVHSFGVVVNFGCEATRFSDQFPGLQVYLRTLWMNLRLPVWREIIIGMGGGDASRTSILRTLARAPGSSVALVVGGAAEALDAAPHTAKLTLRNRKGFVRIALEAGAALVPCFSFGENDVYDNLVAAYPRVLRWQRRLQKFLTFQPVIVSGRGIFTYTGGLIPHRRPITTIVGPPLFLDKHPDPPQELVDQVHDQYMTELETLYEQYREVFDPALADRLLIK